MRIHPLLLLALATPWLSGCSANVRKHEVGPTRMLFEPPSLSRAETTPWSRLAVKAEVGSSFRSAYTASTDGVTRGDVDVKPGSPGNLRVLQGELPALLSLAFRVTETGDFFVQGEMAPADGTYASAWLIGYRTAMHPEGFTPFLEGGLGLLDVYISSTIEKYDETPGFLFLPGSREYVGTESISDYRFVPFPHMGGGLRGRLKSGLGLLAKARTLYVFDAFELGTQAFLNSAGVEADLALTRRLSVHATAELQANTLPDSKLAKSVGMGFTIRP